MFLVLLELRKLLRSVLSDEHKLKQTAAKTPHVDCRVILLFQNGYLRCSIPSTTDMTAQTSFLLLTLDLSHLLQDHLLYLLAVATLAKVSIQDRVSNSFCITAAFSEATLWERSRYSKVANFDLRVFIDENVAGLDVPVDHVGGMEVL